MLSKIFTSSLLIVLLSTLATSFQQGTLWERVISPDGKFSILMPSKPTYEERDVDTARGKVKKHKYSLSNGSSYFAVSYADYPGKPNFDKTEPVLDSVRDGILEGSEAELISEKKISLQTYPGREFTAKGTVEGDVMIFTWRIFLVDDRLYQLAVVVAEKDSKSPDIAKFLTSFDLNK